MAGSALPLRAHDPMSSWATVRATSEALVVEAELGYETAMTVLGLPIDEGVTPARMTRLIRLLGAEVELGNFYRIVGSPEQVPVPLLSAELGMEEEDGIRLVLKFAPRPATEVTVQGRFLHRLHPAHRSALSLLGSDSRVLDSVILRSGQPDAHFLLPAIPLAVHSAGGEKLEAAQIGGVSPPVSAADVAEPERPRRGTVFRTYLWLGIEHILAGYDHLLFLLGLLVACRRLRSAVAVVSCFTLGHSVTLALAALEIVTVPSRVIEPLIALSIVYVGVENLLRRDEPRGRWLITLGFGLVHGFGFAGVLREIGFGGAGNGIVWPLAAFNLGVELGQLAVAAVALPVLVALRRRPALARFEVPAASAVVVALGLFWLVQRLAFTA